MTARQRPSESRSRDAHVRASRRRRPTFAARRGGLRLGARHHLLQGARASLSSALFVLASAAFLVSASGARTEATPAPGASAVRTRARPPGRRARRGGRDAADRVPAAGARASRSRPPVARSRRPSELLASPLPSLPVDPPASLPATVAGDPLASADPWPASPLAAAPTSWPADRGAADADRARHQLLGDPDGHPRATTSSLRSGARATPATACSSRRRTAPPSRRPWASRSRASVESAEPDGHRARDARRARRAWALLRASDVTHRVRALGIGATRPVRQRPHRNIDNWPLVATVQGPAGSRLGPEARPGRWSPAATRSRTAASTSAWSTARRASTTRSTAARARVTGHYCCGPFVTPGHPVPELRAVRPQGASSGT